MKYLVFDHEGEMLDVLDFESQEEASLYKVENPDNFLVKEDDFEFNFEEDDLFEDEDEEDSDEW